MSIFGDVVKSFFTVALSDGVADDQYRMGLEKASRMYMAAVEYHSETEFKKVFQLLETLPVTTSVDRVALYDRYRLLIQSHLKLAEFALQSLRKDINKASNNAQTPDEEKPVKVLQSELATVEQHLEAMELKRDCLMRQSYSVKNDAEVKETKEKVEHLSKRKAALENAILMAQSRGAEKKVMESSYQQKVSASLRQAVEAMVELNALTDLPPRINTERIEFIKEAKSEVEAFNKELKEVVEG